MPIFLQDLRYGLPTLAVLVHNRVFTPVTILTPAIGIGANTAVFSLLHSLILRPLNVPEPERLVRIFLGRKVLLLRYLIRTI
jgi:hypothetical protein